MLIIGLISTIIMIIVAKTKGFNVWAWILAGGLVGLIVVAFLPSAKATNIDENEKQRRRETATNIGLILSILFILIGFLLPLA